MMSCGTLHNNRRWGQDVTLTPGWSRAGQAAKNALRTPRVWAPLLGAVVLQIHDMDEEVAEWAVERTPVFGSQANACRASATLIRASNIAYWLSVLATPGGEHAADWICAKSKGVAVGVSANQATFHMTRFLQNTIGRERPNAESDFTSFPSLHTSYAASQIMLASRNMNHWPVSPTFRTGAKLGLETITVGMAWSRVEARKHYPSDVLAGIALGYFVSAFLTDAFLGIPLPDSFKLSIGPGHGTIVMCFLGTF
ncbi:MAG: phosphatase PAP2 family protein [Gemmatimonadota bacterium]|nr:MAG: phosphatase PAP2 family protein [Gemmatimonadota bacterium]